MALQCSLTKQAFLAVCLSSLAHGARHGPRQAAATATGVAVPGRHLRLDSEAPSAHVAKAAVSVAARAAPDPPDKDPEHQHPEGSKRSLDDITRMQVKMCIEMKHAHAEDFKQFEDCQKMLKKLCHPGSDLVMDGDSVETSTGEGFCKSFFSQSEAILHKMAEGCMEGAKAGPGTEEYKKCLPFMEKLCTPGSDLTMDSDEKETPTGEGYCQKFFPKEDDEKKDKSGKEGDEDGEKKDRSGKEGGEDDKEKPESEKEGEEDGEKKDGSDSSRGRGDEDDEEEGKTQGINGGDDRFHMKEGRDVPAQGFKGPKVSHNDQETSTDDWQSEYGPKSPSAAEVKEICKKHPSNRWCHVYHPVERSWAAAKAFASPIALLLAVRFVVRDV